MWRTITSKSTWKEVASTCFFFLAHLLHCKWKENKKQGYPGLSGAETKFGNKERKNILPQLEKNGFEDTMQKYQA